MSVVISDYVHPLLRNKMPPFFESEIPKEFLANCHECNVCKPTEAVFVEQVRILGNSKCCNYQPNLPNFMVGHLLESQNDLFRLRVFSKPQSELVITPLGIGPSTKVSQNLIEMNSEQHNNRCVFYDDGRCGIWSGVNGICASWICYSIAGFAGRKFWLFLGQLLEQLELELSCFCLGGLGIDIKVKTWEDSIPDAILKEWQEEYPDCQKFYRSCAKIIKQIPKAHIELLFKTKFRAYFEELKERFYKAFRTRLKSHLRFNTNLKILRNDGFYEIIIEPISGYGFKVNRFFLEALKEFDGRTISNVRANLFAKYGVRIPDEQLLLMQNNDVLI